MASTNTAAAISTALSLLPKIAAFEAGQPIEIPVPAESYTADFGGQKIEISEPGFSVTIKKV